VKLFLTNKDRHEMMIFMKTKKAFINLYVDRDMKIKLKKLAERNNRSVSKQALRMIQLVMGIERTE
jgi:hypothetical protein